MHRVVWILKLQAHINSYYLLNYANSQLWSMDKRRVFSVAAHLIWVYERTRLKLASCSRVQRGTELCGLPVFVWPRPGFEIPLVKKITNNSLIWYDIGVILSVVKVNLLIKIWCRMQVAEGQLDSTMFALTRFDDSWSFLWSFISVKWHENLRKYSEFFGKFFSATCQLRNNFIYSIKISAILNLSLSHSSQIILSHPHIPVSLAISFVKLYLSVFLFLHVSAFYDFRYMWRHREGTRHGFTIDYSRNCSFLWKCRAIQALEVSFTSPKRYSRVFLKWINNNRILLMGMFLQRLKGAGLIRVLFSMSQTVRTLWRSRSSILDELVNQSFSFVEGSPGFDLVIS